MAAPNFDSLWDLMCEYSFEVDPDCTEDDLTCVICHKLMVDACQGVCGCQYCHECIQEYMLEGGDKYCPGNKEECNEEFLVLDRDVSRNRRTNKKISKLRVKCPNKGCHKKRELSEMTEHLKVCAKQPVECPYAAVGCTNEGASKDVIEGHLDDERFDHSRLLMGCIDALKAELKELREKHERSEERICNLSRFCLSDRCEFTWRVEGLSEKVAQKTSAIECPNFVLSNFTLRLLVNVSSDDIGLYCLMLNEQGFTGGAGRAVTLALLDQWSLGHHVNATFSLAHPNPNYNAYNASMCAGTNFNEKYRVGSASFIKYSSIKENQLVVDRDSIVLSCVLVAV